MIESFTVAEAGILSSFTWGYSKVLLGIPPFFKFIRFCLLGFQVPQFSFASLSTALFALQLPEPLHYWI